MRSPLKPPAHVIRGGAAAAGRALRTALRAVAVGARFARSGQRAVPCARRPLMPVWPCTHKGIENERTSTLEFQTTSARAHSVPPRKRLQAGTGLVVMRSARDVERHREPCGVLSKLLEGSALNTTQNAPDTRKMNILDP